MEFLQGNDKEFLEFIKKIDEKDKIGVFTHNDPDGIISALILKEILKKDFNFLEIESHDKNLWKNIQNKIKQRKPTKIFFLDLSIDEDQTEDFMKVMQTNQSYYIDHHPISKKANKIRNILRSDSQTSVGFLLFQIGIQHKLIDFDKWKLIGIAAGIADHSFKNKENMQKMQKIYPEINQDKIFESIPGKVANEIGSALIYYSKEREKVYKLLDKGDLSSIKQISNKINGEIQKCLKEFKTKNIYYKETDIYFYLVETKFKIGAMISSMIAKEYPDSIVIVAYFDEEYTKLSARNFNINRNVRELLAKLLGNLKDSSTGGHTCAAGGRFYKKDYEKFIENLEKYNKNL